MSQKSAKDCGGKSHAVLSFTDTLICFVCFLSFRVVPPSQSSSEPNTKCWLLYISCPAAMMMASQPRTSVRWELSLFWISYLCVFILFWGILLSIIFRNVLFIHKCHLHMKVFIMHIRALKHALTPIFDTTSRQEMISVKQQDKIMITSAAELHWANKGILPVSVSW